jgi:hypothetical protein
MPFISPESMSFIERRLPTELNRYIFQYIDIETRIQMLLENRPYFATGSNRLHTNDINANNKNPLLSLLNSKQLTTIYKEGWLKKLYELNGTKWLIKPDLSRLCHHNTIMMPLFGSGEIKLGLRRVELVTNRHPVVTAINRLRVKVKMNTTTFCRGWSTRNADCIPTAALSLLLNINAFDSDINYYLRKKGFIFLIAMIKFIDKIQYKKDEQQRKIIDKIQYKKDQQETRYQEYYNRVSMENEDKRSKKVERAVKQREIIDAKAVKQREIIDAKAVKKREIIAAKAAKKQANQDKAVALKTKKRATLVAKLEKAIAKKARRWVVILANQDNAIAKHRRYRLNIID